MLKLGILLLVLVSVDAETWIRSGYWYTGSAFPIPDIDSTLFTHLVCGFALINTSTFEIYISPSDECYVSTFTPVVRRKNPSVKTLLSISAGEKTNSSTFYTAIAQPFTRRSFIKSSITAARQHGFTGLDLFNLFPNTPDHTANLASFLAEWREAVTKESDTSPLILSLGARYSPIIGSMIYPVASIRKNLDWVHVLSFDYHLPPLDRFTGPTAALYDRHSNLSTDYGINEWIKHGLPANKLVLGLPYHGYAWTLANTKDDGLGVPTKGGAMTSDFSVSYKYIKWYIKSYGVKPVFNSTYVVNYCKIGASWIGYDDVQSIKAKVMYAKGKGLLGSIAFMMTNDDTDWSLSRTARQEETNRPDWKRMLKILLPAAAVAIVVIGTAMYYLKRKLIKPDNLFSSEENTSFLKTNKSSDLRVFTFNEIREATGNFSLENKIGEGGFGPVYKGKLEDGFEVAVKRLSRVSRQGTEEFKNELAITTRLQHVNLLKVAGFCTSSNEQMLIYEFMPNQSLDAHLFDGVKKLSLDWQKRVQIIEGITQGLLYLQEYSAVTIIHRDLKAGNILLDAEMKPKISDFGIARILRKDENAATTCKIVGTYGHVPPEYVKGGIYSRKYDVYSFGVLLLQIISGKKTSALYGLHDNLNLLEHAYQLWKNGDSKGFMDPCLDDSLAPCKMKRCMQVALLCVQEKWEDRPLMVEVSSMLKNGTESMPEPTVPGFSICQSLDGGREICSSDKDVCSINTLTITQEGPR